MPNKEISDLVEKISLDILHDVIEPLTNQTLGIKSSIFLTAISDYTFDDDLDKKCVNAVINKYGLDNDPVASIIIDEMTPLALIAVYIIMNGNYEN